MPEPDKSNQEPKPNEGVENNPLLTPGLLQAITDLHHAVETLKSTLPPKDARAPQTDLKTISVETQSVKVEKKALPLPEPKPVAVPSKNRREAASENAANQRMRSYAIVYGLIIAAILIWYFMIFLAH